MPRRCKPFDLQRGPLVRFILVRIRPDEHWFLRLHHHIISDAWSWNVFMRELGAFYAAAVTGEKPGLSVREALQYTDFAAWQRAAMQPQGPAYRRALDWWAELLKDCVEPAPLPFSRRIRNYFAKPADGFFHWGLEPRITENLERLARSEGSTFFMIRLAAYAALLAHTTKRREVLLATYMTNRQRVELQNLFGPMSNFVMLPLRPDLSRSFGHWLTGAGGVRELVAAVQEHALLPHDALREELRKRNANPPEIRAAFNISLHTAPVRFADLEMTWIERRIETMPWRFTLWVDRYHESNGCHVAFDARRYHPAKVRRFLEQYARFLDAASQRPDRPMSELFV